MKRTVTTSVFLCLFLLIPGLAWGQATVTYTVDSVLDAPDANPGDGTCATAATVCTLRAAIEEANATTADSIVVAFDVVLADLPIAPATELPALTAANISIDGATQDGYDEDNKLIELDGTACTTADCAGLRLSGDNQNVLGLTINSFSGAGVVFESTATDGVVEHNFIGTGTSGQVAGGNGVGVEVLGARNTLSTNVIAASTGAGVMIEGAGAAEALLQENRIGTDLDGSEDLGNGSHGVLIQNGPTQGELFQNTIAFNGGAGVRVTGAASLGNRISENRMFQNAGIGIDIGSAGETPNDPGDPDEGPNRLQNFPEIIEAEYDTITNFVNIVYRVDTDTENAVYSLGIEFFVVDADGEEGVGFIGSDSYTRNDARQEQSASFFRPDLDVTREDFVVATATDSEGNTSEFTRPAVQLPVELAGLRPFLDDGDVVLTWTTLMEKNNAGFYVQRETDGGTFRDIDGVFVASKAPGGTSVEALSYRLRLEDLAPGTHVLRLRQEDLDGQVSYSREVEAAVPAQFAMEAYPSPFRTEATVTLSVPTSQHVTVEVFNLLGQRVAVLHDGEVSHTDALRTTLDASSLPSGLYILRARGETFTESLRLTRVR